MDKLTKYSKLDQEIQCVTIVYHITRSLHLHYIDLEKETNIPESDNIIVSETRLPSEYDDDKFKLDGFELVRSDFKQSVERS